MNHTTISTANYRVQLKPYLDLWMQGARFGRFADELASTNPRFDRDRFLAACRGQ